MSFKSNITTGSARGFTLLELMVCLAIMAILLGIAAPSFNHLIQEQNARSKSSKLFSLLQYSRNLAVNSNTYVTLCPSKDNKRCSKNWKDPLMIFLDKNKNEKVEDPTHIRSIRKVLSSDSENLKLRAAAGRQYIQFNRHGFVNSTNGRLNYCNTAFNDEPYNRALVISLAGRVRIEKQGDSSKPIKC